MTKAVKVNFGERKSTKWSKTFKKQRVMSHDDHVIAMVNQCDYEDSSSHRKNFHIYPSINWSSTSRVMKRNYQKILNKAIRSGELDIKLPPYDFIKKCNELVATRLDVHDDWSN